MQGLALQESFVIMGRRAMVWGIPLQGELQSRSPFKRKGKCPGHFPYWWLARNKGTQSDIIPIMYIPLFPTNHLQVVYVVAFEPGGVRRPEPLSRSLSWA